MKPATKTQKVIVGLRPEDIRAAKEGDEGYIQEVTVSLAELLGNEYYIHSSFGDKDMIARFPSSHPISIGDKVSLYFDLSKLHLFSPTTELCIF